MQENSFEFGNFFPEFIDETKDNSSETNWGFVTLNGMIPLLERLFPEINVQYAIERESSINAWVAPLSSTQYLISVTEGAIKFFVNYGKEFYRLNASVFNTEEEQKILQLWSDLPEKGELPNLLATMAGCCALAAILGHELGHVYEGQFDVSPPTKNQLLINHGGELSADGWAVRVVALFVDPIVELFCKEDYEAQQVTACDMLKSTIVLSAFSCIDKISIVQPWAPKTPNNIEDTHPVGSARLLSAAVSLLDFWLERKGRTPEISSQIAVRATMRILQQINSDTNECSSTVLLEKLLEQYDISYICDSRIKYEEWVR